MQNLMPKPGSYKMPIMRVARISSTDDTGFIQLIFETETQHQGRTEKLSMSVPIPVLEAAGLLRSLRKLQEIGKIPYVSEPNSPSRPN